MEMEDVDSAQNSNDVSTPENSNFVVRIKGIDDPVIQSKLDAINCCYQKIQSFGELGWKIQTS